MPKGLKAFTAEAFSPRNIVQKAVAYTALLTDDQVSATTAITVTLPAISSMIGTAIGKKTMKLKAAAAYALTVAVASGDTIGKMGSWVVPANQEIIIEGMPGKTDWNVISPDTTQGVAGRFQQTVVVNTNGTTPVNVFSSAGAPQAFTVQSFDSAALDVTASNIVLKNGTATVASVAKGTVVGTIVAEEAMANTAVAKASVFTVESSGTGNSQCRIGIIIN